MREATPGSMKLPPNALARERMAAMEERIAALEAALKPEPPAEPPADEPVRRGRKPRS